LVAIASDFFYKNSQLVATPAIFLKKEQKNKKQLYVFLARASGSCQF
jgi:hypothetical protein